MRILQQSLLLILVAAVGKFHAPPALAGSESIVDDGGSECDPIQSCDTAEKLFKFGDITIPKNYSKFEIPDFDKSNLADQGIPREMFTPFDIQVLIQIRGVADVDELEEEITVEMDFHATWFDTVIFAENIGKVEFDEEIIDKNIRVMDPAFLEYIWKPDLFIENVVRISRPAIIVKPIKLLFDPTKGLVVYQTRFTAVIDCEMEFRYYPADTQTCKFNIRSYSHRKNELSLIWHENQVYIEDRTEHNFDIQVSAVGNTTVAEQHVFGLIEVYDVLTFSILARRSLSYHMIQTYLPSMFFIVITWLCFLIPVTMVEARIGVAMTTLLTLTSMFSSVRESTPIVSYIKAIDIWMVACIFFVFSTLLEFTLLVFMNHGGENEVEVANDGEQFELSARGETVEPPKRPSIRNDDGFFV